VPNYSQIYIFLLFDDSNLIIPCPLLDPTMINNQKSHIFHKFQQRVSQEFLADISPGKFTSFYILVEDELNQEEVFEKMKIFPRDALQLKFDVNGS